MNDNYMPEKSDIQLNTINLELIFLFRQLDYRTSIYATAVYGMIGIQMFCSAHFITV